MRIIENIPDDALLQKRLELLKEMTGKIDFDEKAIIEARGMDRLSCYFDENERPSITS